MYSKENCLNAIGEELESSNIHKDVREHYLKVKDAINNPDGSPPKILIFQPVSIGDSIISSLSAELLQIKYPGCTVDYMISNIRTKAVLETNPFINNVIFDTDWEACRKRNTLELGSVGKDYDIVYSLYWWQGSIVKSFLEDLDLPTDYTRVKLYKHKEYSNKANEIVAKFGKPLICLQMDMNKSMYNGMPKWGGKTHALYVDLHDIANVYPLGTETPDTEYPEDIEIMREADLVVCTHGSIEHAAAAVGCQTVSMSTVFDPSLCMAASYQNKYLPENKQHVIVKPKNWCNDYTRCITNKPVLSNHQLPPYGFPDKFPPHMYKPCDYGFKHTCIHDISTEEILDKVKEVVKQWKQ